MFDKNFKINVSGNWCEYQPNKHIDLREIISFECWADQLGNPYRFHLKNGSYHYIERYEIGKQIENVLKEQQAKVEGLQNKLDQHDKLLLQRNKDVQELYDINEKHVAEKAELQKRVDKAIEALKNKIAKVQKYEQDSFDHGAIIGLESALRTVEQALKDGDQ